MVENLRSTVSQEIDLTIHEPPLKKFKQLMAKMSYDVENMKTFPNEIPEMSPNSLKAQLKEDAANYFGSILDSPSNILNSSQNQNSNLDKWRKVLETDHLPSSSSSSLSQLHEKTETVQIQVEEKEKEKDECLVDEIFDSFTDDFFSESEFATIESKIESRSHIKEQQQPVEEPELSFDIDNISESEFQINETFSSSSPYQRVKVLKVAESFYILEGQNFRFPEKVLQCLPIVNGVTSIDFAPIQLILRDDWLHCNIVEDSIINLVGPLVNGSIIIDNEKNFVIVEPDYLISTTVLADSFSCLRRAVISYRTQLSVSDNKPNDSLICGSIVHELVEDAFRTGKFSDVATVTKRVDTLISENIESIFCCGKDEKFIRAKIMEMMQNFPKWCSLYLRKVPAIYGYVQDQLKTTTFGKPSEKATLSISKILDLEENIWSVMFGLKGKVDATVLMKFKDASTGKYNKLVVPFELKTGASTTSVAHRAQTLLYTLLLNDRYRRPVDYGLLFYISTGDLIRIPGWRDEVRSLIMARNRLAERLAQPEVLPPQITNEHLCRRCYQVDNCVMNHCLVEEGRCETSSVSTLFESKTSHLSEDLRREHSEFFKHWSKLITLEERTTLDSKSELWRFETQKRVNHGQCLDKMKLISCESLPDSTGMSKFKCIFSKRSHGEVGGLLPSLLNVHISDGDPVVISCEEPLHFAISIGFVFSICENFVVIHSDRPIKIAPGPDESLDPADEEDSPYGQVKIHQKNLSLINYRIDKDELTSSFGLLRANVYKLFATESEKLLQLIVNKRAPVVCNVLSVETSKMIEYGLYEEYLKMDEFQREAFSRAVTTLDYLLILGMPGTGKTTTLAFIITYFVLVLNKSVLISSHTHSAIDHIALKLQEKNLPILRIGNTGKIDKMIDEASLIANKKFTTVAEVEHCYSTARVVICTSLGLNHPIFMKKRFDFCIVDEASQLTLPSCVGPLRLAQSFILVGDHYQLPPLVRNKEALSGGFGESLFKQLAEAHPSSMVKLCNQYRMNEEIMIIPNELIYQNLLRCGSESVKNQALTIKNDITTFKCNKSCSCCSVDNCWLRIVLNPSCKVLFLNTDSCDALEVISGHSFYNLGESLIIKQLLKSAVNLGIEENQISLISPYRPQLKHLKFTDFPEVEVSTIDKYQGRDKDFIIISLVRSNTSGNIGELLKDWQRLNVAFTRAKKKLIFIGSKRTVLEDISFYKLNSLITQYNWLHNLTSDALEHFLF